jgi:hypothetical protein
MTAAITNTNPPTTHTPQRLGAAADASILVAVDSCRAGAAAPGEAAGQAREEPLSVLEESVSRFSRFRSPRNSAAV